MNEREINRLIANHDNRFIVVRDGEEMEGRLSKVYRWHDTYRLTFDDHTFIPNVTPSMVKRHVGCDKRRR